MTRAKEIIAELKRLFPESLAYEWDTTQGLISGSVEKVVKKAVLSLEFRDNIADRDADMIITHHPPLFGPERCVTNPFYRRMAHGDEVVYAIHSRLDRTGFSNEALAEKLFARTGYRVVKILEDGTAIIKLKAPLSEETIVKGIKSSLKLKSVNAITKKKRVKRVAIHGGEGFNQGHVISASKEGIDLYLAGDIGHHLAEHAHFFDINFIDIGHFSEQEGMKRLSGVLSKTFHDVRFEYVEQEPLWSIR